MDTPEDGTLRPWHDYTSTSSNRLIRLDSTLMLLALPMPAPPSTPRLERLHPREIGQEVDRALARWCGLVPPHHEHPLALGRTPSKLAQRVAALTDWTQTEQGLGAFELDETLIDLMNVLYRRPIDHQAPPIPELNEDPYPDFHEEPTHPVTCVLLAALARRALHPRPTPGEAAKVPRAVLVSASRLAALASVATSRVHQLRDRFTRVGTSIRGQDAARYLTERGVLGFLPEPVDVWGRALRDFRLAPPMDEAAQNDRMHRLLDDYHRLRKSELSPEALAGLERLFRAHRQLASPERRLRTLRKG